MRDAIDDPEARARDARAAAIQYGMVIVSALVLAGLLVVAGI